MDHAPSPSLAPSAADATAPAASALQRLARLAAAAFSVPFTAVVPFGGGDGVAVAPAQAGHLGAATPDPRLACASLPGDAALVVVEDAAKDARFLLPPEARFFACARAETADARVLGAVCLFDEHPRALSTAETEQLLDLAALAALALDSAALAGACAQAEARFQALSEATFDALLILED
ncbi:MAG: hypothetical protein R3181_09140, partial [Rubricoccaceae bacterium]|nr:hypothetical protein [Rubricoccaceae bacterium]